MKIIFSVQFHTQLGENLWLEVSDQKNPQTFEMSYTGNGFWTCELDYFSKKIEYIYKVTQHNGDILNQELVPHIVNFPYNYQEFFIFDQWNLKNFPENYLINKVLEVHYPNFSKERITIVKKHSHWFKVKVPLSNKEFRVVLLGSTPELGNWEYEKAVKMFQTEIGVWEVPIEISSEIDFQYKYAIFDASKNQILDLELGDNRTAKPNKDRDLLHIISDHNFETNNEYWFHGAGISVPVFSLRTANGFGVGEFSDIKKLAEWCSQLGFKIIQLLPINDTTADYSWTDSYPYAAVSNDALHPIYLSLEKLNFRLSDTVWTDYQIEKKALNSLSQIDYEKVILLKWKFIQLIFDANKKEIVKDKDFRKFLKENERWLVPYSVFCVLRDQNKTADFTQWKNYKRYVAGRIKPFFTPKSKEYFKVMMHSWVQYQLHLQLSEAVNDAHQLGVSLKGDLPIGIYRYSVEAWTEPHLFEMDYQAGAPPDFFSTNGQNWGFPTYNWAAMEKDDFSWWKGRFHSLEKYFDALRIDHILGFFRIWRIPISEITGSMGYFHPSIPLRYDDFVNAGLDFSFIRYCQPFINEEIIAKFFRNESELIKQIFLVQNRDSTYSFRGEFYSQKEIQKFCTEHKIDEEIENQLLHLFANRLFITEDINGEKVFHPRFNNFATESFEYLSDFEKEKIYEITQNYFFQRQEKLWEKSGADKLGRILESTNMLICAEDLGFVPKCVPKVMYELGICKLKVQSMSSLDEQYFNPQNADYKTVLTTSTHDTETLRQWWQNEEEITQYFYNIQLGKHGKKPENLSSELMCEVIQQNLQSSAMLVIFPIQDLLVANSDILLGNLDEERINIPSIFPHYWRYRMPVSIEDLIQSSNFNYCIRNEVDNTKR